MSLYKGKKNIFLLVEIITFSCSPSLALSCFSLHLSLHLIPPSWFFPYYLKLFKKNRQIGHPIEIMTEDSIIWVLRLSRLLSFWDTFLRLFNQFFLFIFVYFITWEEKEIMFVNAGNCTKVKGHCFGAT